MSGEDDLQTRLLRARLAAATGAVKPKAAPGEAPEQITLSDGTVMVLDPKTGSYTNAELMAQNVNPGVGMSALAGAVNGFTFGWGDELAQKAGATPLAVERGRATTAAAFREHPVVATGAAVLGGAAGAAPAVAALPEAVTAAGGASMAGAMGRGIVAGAGLGAMQGAGEARPGERIMGAGSGALIGGVTGGIAPPLLAALKAGSRNAWNWVKQTDTTGISRALGISDDAAKVLKAHIDADDPAAAIASLKRAGPDAMLADSGPSTAQLLDTTIAAGGPAMPIARNAVESRAVAAGGRLRETMDTVLGAPPEGIRSAAKDIATRTATARKAAYDAAYAAPINYADDAGRAIEGVLARIPPKTVAAAVQEANDAMREAGVQNAQILVSIAPDGAATFKQMPNVQQLDFLKRALSDIADAERDQFGRLTGAGQRSSRLAADLRDAVGKAVPEYGRAVRLGGDKIAEDKALALGRDLLKPSVTRETVRETMAGASLEARQAAARGLRTAFDEAMENVKATAGNPDTGAREGLKAVLEFSSKANREKAAILLGKEKAAKLFDAFDAAGRQFALRSAIAAGTQTAVRTAGKQAMDTIIEGSPLSLLQQGRPAEASRAIVQALTGATPADRLKRAQAIYGEVARALTEKRGPEAEKALTIIQGAIQGAPVTAAQAELVAKVVTAALAGSAYQTGMQSQRR